MSKERRKFSAEFKAKVALEALGGESYVVLFVRPPLSTKELSSVTVA